MMAYNIAFWASFLMYASKLLFFLFGAMAFVKYLLRRD